MYFLLDACTHPEVLKVIYFAKMLFDIIFILLPICLIIMLMFDFTKAVIASKEEEQIKSTKLVAKRILYAILVFSVPWIVSVIMNILSSVDLATDYTACLTNANRTSIEHYQKLLEYEESLKAAEEEIKRRANKENGGTTQGGELYSNMAKEMIRVAENEIGKTDRTRYGSGPNQPWCAYFVSWVMKNTNYNGKNLFYDIIEHDKKVENPASALCTTYNFNTSSNLKFYYSEHYNNLYNKGTNYTPKPGDTIYFWWDRNWDGNIKSCGEMFRTNSHIAIVHYVKDGYVYIIEGNWNQKVNTRSIPLSSDSIMGYGSWYAASSNNSIIKPGGNSMQTE